MVLTLFKAAEKFYSGKISINNVVQINQLFLYILNKDWIFQTQFSELICDFRKPNI